MVADHEPQPDGQGSDDHGHDEHLGDGPAQQGRGGGRPDQQAEDQERADGAEAADDRHGDEHEEQRVRQTRAHPQRAGLGRAEAEREQRTVEQHGGHQHHDDHACLPAQVGGRHPQRVPEQDGGQAAGVGAAPGDDDDPERQHPDEQQSDAGVLLEQGGPVHVVDPGDHDDGRHGRAEVDVEVQHDGQGDAGQHPVDEGVPEEAHPPQHQPDPDDGGHQRREQPAEEGSLLEAQEEGLDPPLHTVILPVSPARRR